MKKLISVLVATALTIGVLSGCGSSTDSNSGSGSASGSNSAKKSSEGDSLQIVTTIFPEYDWVNNILGDQASNAEVTLLLDNGVDLHSYQPTAEDIMKISTSDLFIYVGGESDEWVEDVLEEADNDDLVAINLLEVLGDSVKEEEVVEGMEAEDEHEHEEGEEEHEDGEDEHEEGEEEEVEYDEHVWLSLKNSQTLCTVIADELESIDPDHADEYKANVEAYNEKLAKLDQEYKAAVDAAPVKTLLFGDRFPFRYMVDDYGLDYYAAFVGCSAETEASFETIAFLSGKVDELKLSAICTIEGIDHKIADSIKNNTKAKDQTILTLNSLQSTTSADVKGGVTYLSVMQNNLEVLKKALK